MLNKFLFPEFNRKFLLRIGILVLVLWGIFYFAFMPCFINGKSMQPTYDSVGFNFCNKLKYHTTPATYGDIVILHYLGRKYYLKRVIGLPGDTIEFRDGTLYRNGQKIIEDYVKLPCDWNMNPVKVRAKTVFVVGDNRSMYIGQHKFGMIAAHRIAGAPLW